MKKVRYKRLSEPKQGRKSFGISTRTIEKECNTFVRKKFNYKVSRTNVIKPKVVPPQIHITKAFNTKRQIERFKFTVKGTFYLTHNRVLVRVNFQHSLYIQIIWKAKDFSPKKSAVLTK